jgi:hypothetical protein
MLQRGVKENFMRYVILLLALAGCATPETILKNDKNEYASCGGSSVGSITGGMIGYDIQKNNDEKCVKDYTNKGYIPVN